MPKMKLSFFTDVITTDKNELRMNLTIKLNEKSIVVAIDDKDMQLDFIKLLAMQEISMMDDISDEWNDLTYEDIIKRFSEFKNRKDLKPNDGDN